MSSPPLTSRFLGFQVAPWVKKRSRRLPAVSSGSEFNPLIFDIAQDNIGKSRADLDRVSLPTRPVL